MESEFVRVSSSTQTLIYSLEYMALLCDWKHLKPHSVRLKEYISALESGLDVRAEAVQCRRKAQRAVWAFTGNHPVMQHRELIPI